MSDKKKSFEGVIFDTNKRSATRVSAELEVTVSGSHNFFQGMTEDISKGGLFVATRQIFPIGTEFEIRLHIKGNDVRLKTKVAWIREDSPFLPENIEPGMGLEFTNVPDNVLELINRFIREKEPIFFDDDV